MKSQPRASTPFHLTPRESVRNGLIRLTRSLADSLPASPTADPKTLPTRIHHARLALKRARAVVRLLRPTVGARISRRWNDRLKTAARSLAEARDAAVGLKLLRALERKKLPAATRTALAQVRTAFAKSVHDPAHSPTQLHRGLSQARTALQSIPASLGKTSWNHSGWKALAAGLETGYRRARKRFRNARKSQEPKTLHEWRTASKSLLYQVAIVRPIAERRLKRFGADLDALQQTLGDANDIATLAGCLNEAPDRFGGPEAISPVTALLHTAWRQNHKTAIRLGQRIFQTRTSDFIRRLEKDWRAWRKT